MEKVVNIDGSPYEPPEPVEKTDDTIGLNGLVARLLADQDRLVAVLCVLRFADGDESLDGTEMLTDTQKALAVNLMGMVQVRDVFLYDEEYEDDEADDND